jgi:hypothetical protein
MTSVMPIPAQKDPGFTARGKNSIERQVCKNGTASAGPLNPLADDLGFSPCKVPMNKASNTHKEPDMNFRPVHT